MIVVIVVVVMAIVKNEFEMHVSTGELGGDISECRHHRAAAATAARGRVRATIGERGRRRSCHAGES